MSEQETKTEEKQQEPQGSIIKHATLREAFVYAQAEFTPIVHNCGVDFTTDKGRRVKYSYADLPQVQKSIYPALNKHGLSITYSIEDAEGGVYLVIEMMHAFSGDEKIVKMKMVASEDPKEFAGEITYTKRYLLCLITGTASEEDGDADRLPSGKQQQQQGQDQQERQRRPGQPQDKTDKDDSGKAADQSSGKREPKGPEWYARKKANDLLGLSDLKDYLGGSSKKLTDKDYQQLVNRIPECRKQAQWMADELNKPVDDILAFAPYFPGCWLTLYDEILLARKPEGGIDTVLWPAFTEWEKKREAITGDSEYQSDLSEARKRYIDMIAGKFGEPTDPKLRLAWEQQAIGGALYADWTLAQVLKAIEKRQAVDAADDAFGALGGVEE